ncbi:hypothetical protein YASMINEVIRUS_1400 [Yasminevirus sp. GU-2018]|uniref:EF-hand domain-containing protein n=1 Tax=Yasminevirus sp. GU-2018 TaxID=2420051 RepID=A0A5K0UA29_9VIRU|nr:hypothetical protein YASMINEVIRUS_1400 [Yasminevirus sp. GU-2018]
MLATTTTTSTNVNTEEDSFSSININRAVLNEGVKKVVSVVYSDIDSDQDGSVDVADVYTTFSMVYGYNDVDLGSITTLIKANSTVHNGIIDFTDFVNILQTLCTGTLIRSPLVIAFIYSMLDISHKHKTLGMYYELITTRLKVLDTLSIDSLSIDSLRNNALFNDVSDSSNNLSDDDLLFKEFLVCVVGMHIRHILTIGSITMNIFYLMICMLAYYLLF